MCLVAVAWQAHPHYPLVLLGNRDEYHARPATGADWWPDAPHILGGRDLKAGGSWLAVHRSGRVAVVTNYPGRPAPSSAAPSRGELVRAFVAGQQEVAGFFQALAGRASQYAGFSLLAAAPDGVGLFAAEDQPLSRPALSPGVHALSNSPLDTPWPKVGWLAQRLTGLLASEADLTAAGLLDLLMHRGPVGNVGGLPGVAGRPFVLGDEYGTRASTVLLLTRQGELRFSERRYGPGGLPLGESHFAFAIETPPAGGIGSSPDSGVGPASSSSLRR